MVISELFDVYKGEIRIYNRYYDLEVGIVNTAYNTWVKNSYLNCDVEKIELEMLNTAVLSARMLVTINDEAAGMDSGDTEEATKKDIEELVNNIYDLDEDTGEIQEEETIRFITEDYYDKQPLAGDENDFGTGCPDEENEAVEQLVDEIYPEQPDPCEEPEDEEEATEEDICCLLGSVYKE